MTSLGWQSRNSDIKNVSHTLEDMWKERKEKSKNNATKTYINKSVFLAIGGRNNKARRRERSLSRRKREGKSILK